MAETRTKTTAVRLLLLLLYLVAAFILNIIFPNLIITYLILGSAVIVSLVQLKKQNFKL